MLNNLTTGDIIKSAMKVHTQLGPGLLENVYRECLFFQLTSNGYFVEKEKPLPVFCEGVKLDVGYRIDLLVAQHVVVEVKSIEQLHPIHFTQTLTYMRLGNFKLGLLINFNVMHLKDGLKRWVN